MTAFSRRSFLCSVAAAAVAGPALPVTAPAVEGCRKAADILRQEVIFHGNPGGNELYYVWVDELDKIPTSFVDGCGRR